jgi:hypothetical protein
MPFFQLLSFFVNIEAIENISIKILNIKHFSVLNYKDYNIIEQNNKTICSDYRNNELLFIIF